MAGARHRSLCKFRGRRNVLEDSPRSQTQLSWRLLRRLTSLWLHRKLEGSKNSCLLWGLVRTANQDAGLCYVIGAWRGTLPAEVLSVRCIPCITMHPTNTNKKIASKTTSKTFPGRHGVQQEAPSSVSTFAGYPPTPPRRLPSFANTTQLASSTKAGVRNIHSGSASNTYFLSVACVNPRCTISSAQRRGRQSFKVGEESHRPRAAAECR